MTIEQILDDTKVELSHTDQLSYLHRYNYFEGLVENARSWSFKEVKKSISPKTPEYSEALTRFQLFFGLEPTGEMNDETQKAMMEPRCSCPDMLPKEGVEAARAFWPIDKMNGVTYSCNLDQLNLGKSEATRIYKLAGEAWNKVCGIGLKFSTDYGHANINAEDARIDSRWNILAWSQLPTGRIDDKCQQRFDTMENWYFEFLLAVAIHELGHALGWGHLNNRQSILFPSWQRDIVEPQPVDIKRAVEAYGRPNDVPDEPDEPVDRLTKLERRVSDLEKLFKLILENLT
jgi:hypothetical protein